MGKTVQFIGRDNVVTAYESRGIDVWGLFDGKNMITCGDTADELRDFLMKMERSHTEAIYTLKVYSKVEDADEVDSRTPDSGAVNFKLSHSNYSVSGTGGVNAQLDARLKAIEDKLNGEDDDDDEKPKGLEGMLMGLLEKPEELIQVIGMVKSIFTKTPPVGAAVAGIPPNPANDRLEQVINRLSRHDEHIILHLEKLADLAERKPSTFKFLIDQLDGGNI